MFTNALKAKWSFNDKHFVDFLYFDNPVKDGMALHSSDTALVEWDERGGGLYGIDKSNTSFPFEYYYVYKDEDREGVDGRPVHLNTFGTRLLPEIGKNIKGNIEVATQSGSQGDRSVGGTMVDAFFNWAFIPEHRHKPTFTAGYFYLTGDDPSTSDNEEWHPIMSRWTLYSDFSSMHILTVPVDIRLATIQT